MTYYSETPREGISLPDGTFKGVLKDGKPSWGTLTDLCGIIYEGEFQDGKIQGKGIMTFPEGQRYEGDFVNEKFEGDPVCITRPNGNRYEGQFANGKFEGRGIYTWASGERYEGDFVNGEQHGKGVFYMVGRLLLRRRLRSRETDRERGLYPRETENVTEETLSTAYPLEEVSFSGPTEIAMKEILSKENVPEKVFSFTKAGTVTTAIS